MPWTSKDAQRHTAKADTPNKQAVWAKVANQALDRCRKEQGKDCDGRAIRIANASMKARPKQRKTTGQYGLSR